MSYITRTVRVGEDGYLIERFREADAHAISCNFRKVYGDHYVSPAVYDPANFVRANREGTARSFVVRDPLGAVVGHLALVKSTPFRGTRELAQGIVLPEHRRAGLLNRLIAYAIAEAEAEPDCAVVFGTAVCNHVFSQRGLHGAGFTAMAIEANFVPARMFAKEQSAGGPVATVLQYRPLRPAPRLPVHLPERYADTVQALFSSAGDARRFLPPAPCLPPDSRTLFQIADQPGFDTTRMVVQHAGLDLAEAVQTFERNAAGQGRMVVQIALDLGSPTVDVAVELLREQGYWFGGVLPRWVDTDALLMQKTFERPAFAGIKLFSDHAQALLRLIEADWLTTLPALDEVASANDNDPAVIPDGAERLALKS